MKIAIVDSGLGVVSLLKKIIKKDIRHDIDLLFTSFCPIGNLPESLIMEEAMNLKKRIDEKKYDKVIICCNTLSSFFEDLPYIKILDLNKKYLMEHKDVIPVGTISTIFKLGYGYGDSYLAKDLEKDDLEGIMDDLNLWPKNKKLLLCCTHYYLIIDLLNQMFGSNNIIDLTENLADMLVDIPYSQKLKIDYGGKEEQIRQYLQF